VAGRGQRRAITNNDSSHISEFVVLSFLRSIALIVLLVLASLLVTAAWLVALRASGILPAGTSWTGFGSVPEFLGTCLLYISLGWLYGWVLGRFDKRSMREMAELLIIIGLVSSIGGVVDRWNGPSATLWRWLLLSVNLFLCIALGGWIAMRRR
jgi:hypothetical protein